MDGCVLHSSSPRLVWTVRAFRRGAAAPQVAGVAAQMTHFKSFLKAWPETVRAVMLAGAIHNVEGSAAKSEKDGSGAVEAWASWSILNLGWYQSFSDAPPQSHEIQFYVPAGERVRAAIAWGSSYNSGTGKMELWTDYDLAIYDQNGNYVTASASYDMAQEVVEFVASSGGWYKARIGLWSTTAGSEWLGFAYWHAPV